MADIKTPALSQENSLQGEESAENQAEKEALIQAIELLFFAYRDFVSDPDAILEADGLGRAHHRVMHFVDRKPGLTAAWSNRRPAPATGGNAISISRRKVSAWNAASPYPNTHALPAP